MWLPWLALILSLLAISLGSYNILTTAYTGLSTQDNRISNIEKAQAAVLQRVNLDTASLSDLKALLGVDMTRTSTAFTALQNSIATALPCNAIVLIPANTATAGWTVMSTTAAVTVNNVSYVYINNPC